MPLKITNKINLLSITSVVRQFVQAQGKRLTQNKILLVHTVTTRAEIELKVEDQCYKSQGNVKIMIISKEPSTLLSKDKIFSIVRNAR
jgi:hypothetical protein